MTLLNRYLLMAFFLALLIFPGCNLFHQTTKVKKQDKGIYTLWTPGKALRSQVDFQEGKRHFHDLNQDGKKDMVLIKDVKDRRSKNKQVVKFLMNKGNARFKVKDSVKTPISIEALSFQDFNKDGLPDLLIKKERHPSYLYRNKGEGRFQIQDTLDTEDWARVNLQYHTYTKDLNGDGYRDFIAWKGEGYKIYMNDGNGNLSFTENIDLNDYSEKISFHDLNGDGMKDLLIKINSKKLKVFLNKPDSNFQFSETIRGNKIHVGNFDQNDGAANPDILTTVRNQIKLYSNNGNGKFGDSKTIPFDNLILKNTKPVYVKDMNEDGQKDLCIVGQRQIKCLLNAGNGQFNAAEPIKRPEGYEDIFIKNLCCGASPDVLLRDSNQLILYPNKGNGSFKASRSLMSAPFNEEKTFKELHFADLVGDQKYHDLILITENQTLSGKRNPRAKQEGDPFNLHLYLNKGDGSFTKQPNGIPLTSEYWKMELTDLKGNRATDLLIHSGRGKKRTDIYLNRYPGSSKEKDGRANNPPIVMAIPDTINFIPNKDYTVRAGDPDGDPLTMSLVDTPANATFKHDGSGIAQFSYDPEKVDETVNPTSFTLSVKDDRGGKNRKRFTIPGLINKKHEEWRFKANGLVRGEAVINDGIIYFGSMDNYLHALDAQSGEELWHFKTAEPVVSTPVVKHGKVYFGAGSRFKGGIDGRVYALDAKTGKEQWQFKMDGPVQANVHVSGDKVYAGSLGGDYYALDAGSGKKLWQFCLCYGVRSSNLSSKNGQVFIIYDEPRSRYVDLDSAMESGRCNLQNCNDSILAKAKDTRNKQGLLVLNSETGKLISHYKPEGRRSNLDNYGIISKPILKNGKVIL